MTYKKHKTIKYLKEGGEENMRKKGCFLFALADTAFGLYRGKE
jgi:hypothetical protein